MKEYYKDPDATASALIYDENGVSWYKTEDVAHFDENGSIFIDGRLRRIEITKDANGVPTKVFPDRAKQIISMHPVVDQCEVIKVKDKKKITRPVAYLVLRERQSLSKKLAGDIKAFCIKNGLESNAIPDEYIQQKVLPKNKGMKVDIGLLEKMYSDVKSPSVKI